MNSNSTSRLKRSLTNEESKRSPSKRQFRNENEKRRRDLFSQLISNLEEILEIPSASSSTSNKLDKASILRETSLFLRQHQSSSSSGSSGAPSSSSSSSSLLHSSSSATDRSTETIDFTWKPPSSLVTLHEWTQILIESMNSFLLITKSDPYNGQIVFVSKNISSLLDYSQDEVLNRSLFEFVSARDQDLLRDYFLKEHQILERCSVGWRRATADEYEQCSIIGAFRSVKREKDAVDQEEKYLMSIVQVETTDRTLLVQQEILLEEFSFRLNLQGKLIHFDLKACEYLGYHPDELIGQTYLNYIHPDDLPVMVRAHQLWKDFGNGTTDPYRFLTKGQQWIFLQSQCQVQMNSWTGKPEYYLCKTNLLINSADSIPAKQICPTSIGQLGNPLVSRRRSLSTNVSVASREIPPSESAKEKTLEIQRKPSPDQSQITSFLSQLSNEGYRRNIREKFVERRSQKQSEIRLREEEIAVIDDMITFIDNYQAKQPTDNRLPEPPTSQTTEQPDVELHRTFLQDMNQFERNFFRSPLNATIDDDSPQSSPLLSSRLFVSFDGQFVVPPPCSSSSSLPHLAARSTTRETNSLDTDRRKDDCLLHSHSSTISSPSDNPLSMSCPATPYSSVSRPSPNSPFTVTLSPATNEEIQHILQPPSTLVSLPPSTATTATSSGRPSSFNRSLPHSLVS